MSNAYLYYPLFAASTALLDSVTIFTPLQNVWNNGTQTYDSTTLWEMTDTYDDTMTKALQGMFASAFGFAIIAAAAASRVEQLLVPAQVAAFLSWAFTLIGMIILLTNSDYDLNKDSFGAYAVYVALGLSTVTFVKTRNSLTNESLDAGLLSSKSMGVVIPFVMALLEIVALSYPSDSFDYNNTGNMNSFIALWVMLAFSIATVVFVTGPAAHTGDNDAAANGLNFVMTLIPAIVFTTYAYSGDATIQISDIQKKTVLAIVVVSGLVTLLGVALGLGVKMEDGKPVLQGPKATVGLGTVVYLVVAIVALVSDKGGSVDYNLTENLNAIVCIWLVIVFSGFGVAFLIVSSSDKATVVAGLLISMAVVVPSIIHTTYFYFSDTLIHTTQGNSMTAVMIISGLYSLTIGFSVLGAVFDVPGAIVKVLDSGV